MANPFRSDALKSNMAESLARRPAGPAVVGQAGQFNGRAKLVGACVVEIGRLVPDADQPRKSFPAESIERLAESFKARGQLVPILARWSAPLDRYIIVDGERRYRAALVAGVSSLAAVDVTQADPAEILEVQLVINALREDVQPVEQARSYESLMKAKGYSQRQLADRLNVDHSTIARALAMLTLPAPIQEAVDAGAIRPQAAYELSRVEDPAEQADLAERAKAGNLKREELRARVARTSKPKGRGGKPAKVTERFIRTATGPRVTVEWSRGLGPETIAAALRDALAVVEGECVRAG